MTNEQFLNTEVTKIFDRAIKRTKHYYPTKKDLEILEENRQQVLCNAEMRLIEKMALRESFNRQPFNYAPMG